MKTCVDNICQTLGETIRKALAPLIPGDYILLDLPYYANIGDILIWRGTEDFLKEMQGNCLGRQSKETFNFRPLPIDSTILLQGGGNFGDIWREHQEFRLEVMRLYPENNIIVLPQTVHYESEDLFSEDVKKMNQHSHLTICARDNHSAELLRQKGFMGRLLTLPDMAFCINQQELQSNLAESTKQCLILLREDKELKEKNIHNKYTNASFSDWPNIKESSAEAWDFLMTHDNCEIDSFFIENFFPREIKAGVEFVSSFTDVCSTRLHVAILRLLLGLPVKMIDNSYGKNLNFYNTWLKDSNLASLPDEVEQDAIDLATFVYRQEQEAIKKNAKEYEKLITELREQGNNYEETILNRETTIASLRQKLNRESQKHKKYKQLFNLSLLFWLLLLIFTLITIFNK